jgi:hypothetical protein
VGTSLYGSGHGYVVPGTESTTSKSGRVRRRFEDAAPEDGDTSVAPSSVGDDDDAARKKKKAKTEKDKKLKDFKF